MTVDEFCKQNPKMQGCEPAGECIEKECGVHCQHNEFGKDGGICDGGGHCVHPMTNPCSQHGCNGKICGEGCLMGDILGWCDNEGTCASSPVQCGKYKKKSHILTQVRIFFTKQFVFKLKTILSFDFRDKIV